MSFDHHFLVLCIFIEMHKLIFDVIEHNFGTV
jgi:hypothetical protein